MSQFSETRDKLPEVENVLRNVLSPPNQPIMSQMIRFYNHQKTYNLPFGHFCT